METFCNKRSSGVESPARAKVNIPSKKLQNIPQDELNQNLLGDKMVEWAHKPEAFDIESFPLSLMMNPIKFFKIAEINEYFKDCLSFTRLMLYTKRAKQCSSKETDNAWLTKTMPLYHELYETFVLQRAKQVSEGVAAGSSKTTFTLCNCLKWPSSDQVKPREENDNVRHMDQEAQP